MNGETMKNNVTIYSLAEELGMTPSMVSRAFNPNAKIAKEKRRAVLDAAERYGFVPNKLASRLSMKKVRIGILIVYKAQHVCNGLKRGFETAFQRLRDYKLEYIVKEIAASEKSAYMCREELFELSDCDGVILSGFGSSLCHDLICDFAKVNPNIVFVQNLCENTPFLFASKHDERLAASLAAQLLFERLYYSERKNVFVFTGDRTSSVHSRCYDAFCEYATAKGLQVIGDFDMKDSDEVLAANIEKIFENHGSNIDGIYISSGNSSVLCEHLLKNKGRISLVCSDVTDSVCSYIENGTAFATICQNFELQADNAFSILAEYLLNVKKAENTVYSDVVPVLSANLELYRNK